MSAERICMVAALSLKRSTAAIGAWSGSLGCNAARADPLDTANQAAAINNPMRILMSALLLDRSTTGIVSRYATSVLSDTAVNKSSVPLMWLLSCEAKETAARAMW
jgi:hypothetical protein